MSKLTINHRGSVKTVPAAHAKILIALGKATLVEDKPEPAETQTEPATLVEDKPVDTEPADATPAPAAPAKRSYKRKDMQAEGE